MLTVLIALRMQALKTALKIIKRTEIIFPNSNVCDIFNIHLN